MAIPKSDNFDAFVNQLESFTWGQTTLPVSLDGLVDNPGQLASALNAFKAWTELTGLKFKFYHGLAAINFKNTDPGAQTTPYNVPGTPFTVAMINVNPNWKTYSPPGTDPWAVGYYGFQTFLHEIGHAIGLHHGGDYDIIANYPDNAKFAMDTWQFSVMSYFLQSEYNLKNGNTESPTDLYLVAPMMADILAIRDLYGYLPVHSGGTNYGAGSHVGYGWTDFGAHPYTTYCINDTGGYDTIDLSDLEYGVPLGTDEQGNQVIGNVLDLREGHFSDINGLYANVSIAPGTIIERVIGSIGADFVYGNDADNTIHGENGNDWLYGGKGNDRLFGDDGSDTLEGGPGADYINGGAGDDTVVFYLAKSGVTASLLDQSVNTGDAKGDTYVSIENLHGSYFDDVLIGDGGANTLSGDDGNDILFGAGGHDTLIGGSGADYFVFGNAFAAHPNLGIPAISAASTVIRASTVVDFSAADGDKIVLGLKAFEAIAGKDMGSLSGDQFINGTHAKTPNQHIIYDAESGNLWYDANGSNDDARMLIATIENHASLSASDFLLVA